MDVLDYITVIGQAITFIGVLFIVYSYFKNPQIKLEKKQLIAEEELKDKASVLAQKEVENKASVLEKQFGWFMDANNQKFIDMGKRLDEAFLLAANHTNTVDKKVDELIKSVNLTNLEVAKLGTIISERIPKK